MYPLNVEAVKANWGKIEKITITVVNPETKETVAKEILPAKEILAYEVLLNCFDEKVGLVNGKLPQRNSIDPRIFTFDLIKTKIENLLKTISEKDNKALTDYLIKKELNRAEIEMPEICYFKVDCKDCEDCGICEYYKQYEELRQNLEKEYMNNSLYESLNKYCFYKLWYVQPNLFWGYEPIDINNPDNAIIKIEYC